jgi:hypothetical protein
VFFKKFRIPPEVKKALPWTLDTLVVGLGDIIVHKHRNCRGGELAAKDVIVGRFDF